MRLEELKDSLTQLADEVPTDNAHGRLAGVDDKIRNARRSRGIAAGTVAMAVVAAIAVGAPLMSRDHSAEPVRDPDADPQRLATVTDKGVSFYKAPAGDTLVGSVVGDVGETRVEATATPTTANIAFAVYCSGAEGMADLTVNGKPQNGTSCSDPPDTVAIAQGSFGNGSDASNEAAWRDSVGVTAGGPVDFSVRFRPDDKAKPGHPQLAVALYELTGEKVRDHGVWINTEVVADGRTFRLADSTFATFDDGESFLELPRPAGGGDVWVSIGLRGVSSASRIDGPGREDSSASEFGGALSTGSILERSAPMAMARVRTHGDPTGMMYLLLYTEVR